ERLRRDQTSSTAVPVGAATARRRGGWLGWAAVALLLAATAAGLWWTLGRASEAEAAQGAVAVLPFDNRGGDEDLDYLRLALPDEITTALTFAPTLAVRPFEPDSPLAGDPLESGRNLRAATVVTGHFAPEGGVLGITLEAIDVAANRLLWRQRVTAPAADVLALREQVAGVVRSGLLPALGRQQTPEGATRPADSVAYESYLRSLAVARDPEPNQRAIEMLESAVEQDPSYAPAWAELSARYAYKAYYAQGGAAAMRRAEAAARRAIELDPDLVEAAARLVTLRADAGDLPTAYAGAEALVRRRGDSAEAHFALAYVHRYAGYLDEAKRHCEAAHSLDPTNYQWRSCAMAFTMSGDLQAARRFLDLDAGSHWAALVTPGILLREGDRSALRPAMDRQPADSPFRGFMQACLERDSAALAENGRSIIESLSEHPDPEPMYWWGAQYSLCGEPQAALHLLAMAIERGYCAFPAIDRDPAWEALRGEPELRRLRDQAIACRSRFAAAVEELTGSPPGGREPGSAPTARQPG
ncbi:MAG TPA: tetratricopeptide repeat protein, partial [Thermoanaerobaculia bacterium]|nr:tetratricopeptide repeat protein [Thermoanaerobaculia bacterium]